jgi:hypothetical protein
MCSHATLLSNFSSLILFLLPYFNFWNKKTETWAFGHEIWDFFQNFSTFFRKNKNFCVKMRRCMVKELLLGQRKLFFIILFFLFFDRIYVFLTNFYKI